VKPANLLLPTAGGVKIVDFGIASAADAVSLTRTGTVIGTAMYMSPEQASGQRATGASDLYGLGAVAYAALAGRPPFDREAAVAVAMAHIADTPDPLPADVPAELGALVMALLAKDPAQRPTAQEVALQATAMRERMQSDTSELPRPTLVLPAAAIAPPDLGQPDVPRRDPRRRWLLAGVAAALAMFVGLALGLSDGLSVPKAAAKTAATHHHRATTKPTPSGVLVKQASYLGLAAGPVVDALKALGMNAHAVNSPSSLPTGTVIAVLPHGRLARGTQVDVVVATKLQPAAHDNGKGPDKPEPPHGHGHH